MENGDYSFDFPAKHISRREKELNQMLNRIKEILINARKDIIKDEEFLSTIVETVSTGIIISDEKGYINNANQAALQLLGMSSLSHINQLQIIDESFPELFLNMKPGENPPVKINTEKEEYELSLRLSEIYIAGNPFKIITLNNIGSELQAKEMESWISLIRVMTHEIMNSIAPITSLSESLLFSFRSQAKQSLPANIHANTIDSLETINATTKGLLNFVESYRRFTRIPKPQPTSIDINNLLEKVINLHNNDLQNRDIQVEVVQKEDTMRLYADESQVYQIMVNLMRNAIEAFNMDYTIYKRFIRIVIVKSANQINIKIQNNGAAIPKDVLPHIFVPFFTTKESGSGIGLSLSRYIMRLHGGNLKYHSENEWTVFTLAFPSV